jgi:hypothetical protein
MKSCVSSIQLQSRWGGAITFKLPKTLQQELVYGSYDLIARFKRDEFKKVRQTVFELTIAAPIWIVQLFES